MPRSFTVTALMSAHNEADIIGQVIADLVAQGISVFLLDHGSTDGTLAEAEPYVGRGLLAVESLPLTGGGSWEAVLRRKEALALELESDWFLHADADEFRESPWPGVNLLHGIRKVDALGYNAIDFEVLNFPPTDDRFRPGDDVRAAFQSYEPGAPLDKIQVRCWKKGNHPVDLVSLGGHDASFPDRRVFPIRFILRHYPIRSQAHGERKVLSERPPRFGSERARGWHLQYDGIREGHCFIRDPATLIPYDADKVRLELALRHRGVEALTTERDMAREEAARRGSEIEKLSAEAARREAEIARLEERISAAQRQIEGLRAEVERLQNEAAQAAAERSALETRLGAVLSSRSWRWTALMRTLLDRLRG